MEEKSEFDEVREKLGLIRMKQIQLKFTQMALIQEEATTKHTLETLCVVEHGDHDRLGMFCSYYGKAL